MKKIALYLSRRKLIVVEIKDDFFDLTSINTNVINDYALKITAGDFKTQKAIQQIQSELKKHVRILINKKKTYVGLIAQDYDFKKLERKFKTEVYYYH